MTLRDLLYAAGRDIARRRPPAETNPVPIASQPLDAARALRAALVGASERAVAELARIAHVRRYTPGQIVFRKGEPSHSLLVVLEGRIAISSLSAEGAEVILNIVDPGEVVGEIGALDGGPRSADATALGDTLALVLLRRELLLVLQTDASAARALLLLLCGRLRRTTAFVEDTVFRALPARLLHQLQALARRYGRSAGASLRIEHGLSQQTVADSIGASRVSVNRQLNAWRAQGLLDFGRGFIVIHRSDWLASGVHRIRDVKPYTSVFDLPT
jgi:CRP/FNR family transcriptional regulator, cyclic AMP receptor protein